MSRNFSNVVAADIVTSSTLNDSTTTITIDDGTTLPSADFAGRIDSEVVLVTGVAGASSTSLTVTRGFDGTTAATHASGAGFQHVVIADDMAQTWVPEWIRELGTAPSPHASDDEFDDGSLAGAWTTLTVTGAQTITEGKGLLSVNPTSAIDAADFNAILRSYSISTGEAVEVFVRGVSSIDTKRLVFGPVISDGVTSSSNCAVGALQLYNADEVGRHQIATYPVDGTFTNVTYGSGAAVSWLPSMGFYIRLEYEAANTFDMSYSFDGVTWHAAHSNTHTMTPTHIGFAWATYGDAPDQTAVAIEYCRIVTV